MKIGGPRTVTLFSGPDRIKGSLHHFWANPVLLHGKWVTSVHGCDFLTADTIQGHGDS